MRDKDAPQTAEEAHAELVADGVDVAAFLSRVEDEIDRALLTCPAIVRLCHRVDRGTLDGSDRRQVAALLRFWARTKGAERRARESAAKPSAPDAVGQVPS